jgi:general stress protein 26
MQEFDSNHDFEKFNQLIKDMHIAMMTTVAADGSLRSRPMAAQQLQPDGTLWFLTEARSPKIEELHRDNRVNISFADEKGNRFVSMSGMAEEVFDRAKVKDLWNPLYKAWFPNGPEDPNVVALRVDVSTAEYWDSAKSTMVYAIGLAKAAITGRRYEGEATDHGRISFQ